MANAAHAARKPRRPKPAPAFPVLSLAAVLAVSGCSLPGLPGPTGAPEPTVQQAAVLIPVQTTSEGETDPPPASENEPAPPPETEPAPPAAPRIVAHDLANGSASRSLGAAGNQLVVNYWTAENAALWTPESSPIIQLSATVAGAAEDRIIKITRFNARVDALDAVLANDTGDFAIGNPHSYSSAVVVPGNPGAETTRIVFTFDLLTETGPMTGVFTRQTVMDSITIGYAVPAPSPSSIQN